MSNKPKVFLVPGTDKIVTIESFCIGTPVYCEIPNSTVCKTRFISTDFTALLKPDISSDIVNQRASLFSIEKNKSFTNYLKRRVVEDIKNSDEEIKKVDWPQRDGFKITATEVADPKSNAFYIRGITIVKALL